jgi:hypothetical protein
MLELRDSNGALPALNDNLIVSDRKRVAVRPVVSQQNRPGDKKGAEPVRPRRNQRFRCHFAEKQPQVTKRE